METISSNKFRIFFKTQKLIIVLSLILLICTIGCKENAKECEYMVLDWPEEIENCITDEEKTGLRDGTKSKAKVWRRMKADCPNVKKYDNGALLDDFKAYPDAILVSSKKDMMKKLKEKSEADKCCIKTLHINGHGDDGNVSVGAGKTNGECKYINGDPNDKDVYNKDDWQSDLADLRGLLCEGSVIKINACNFGTGDIGRYKMEEVAQFFDSTVEAPTVTIDGGTGVDDQPEDKKRRVEPPKSTIIKPNSNAKSESNLKKKKQIITNELKGRDPFKDKIIQLGIYPSYVNNIPDLSIEPELPISDSDYILEFINSIDTTKSYDITNQGYKTGLLVLIKYEDKSYDVGSVIFNSLFFELEVEDRDYLFESKDNFVQVLKLGVQLSGYPEEAEKLKD